MHPVLPLWNRLLSGLMEDSLQENEPRMTPHSGGQLRQRDTASASHENTGRDSPDWAVQVVLAAMMAAPHREVMSLIQEAFPGRDVFFYAGVLKSAKALVEELTGGLDKRTDVGPSPTLLDRLSFCWAFLRKADVLVWKLKKAKISDCIGIKGAAAAFQSILSVPLQEPLLKALLVWLRLGPDALFLSHYYTFRRTKPPTTLPGSFSKIVKNGDRDLLRTVIWWCIRARREEYVEVRPNERVQIAFPFVVEQVLEDLKGWCGPEIEQMSDVTGEIERELNQWLTYSRLELSLEDSASDSGPDPETAKAFVRHNELTTKLRVQRAGGDSGKDERVRQLESQLGQYAEENRILEERLRSLEGTHRDQPASPVDSDAGLSSFAELREMLKIVDTKYAFDTLNSVQLGEETHLTLRSFVTHLFYALRKRGFTEYPNEEEFALTYEASGLYDCDGFEVPPAGSVHVKVVRKGWAFNARGKWLPVRRARVISSCEKDSPRNTE